MHPKDEEFYANGTLFKTIFETLFSFEVVSIKTPKVATNLTTYFSEP